MTDAAAVPQEKYAGVLGEIEAVLREESERSEENRRKWPLLLHGLEKMHVKTLKYTPTKNGYLPSERPLSVHLDYGIIKLDKPCNPSSHEIAAWVKSIYRCAKTGQSGTLDPMVSGCLPICLNKATRIAKAQQNAGKEYVAVVRFDRPVGEKEFRDALQFFQGPLLQRPPEQCAVKRTLRLREVYKNTFIQYDPDKGLGVFRTSCQAGTYIRTLCVHLGLRLGVKGEMVDLRRTRSGVVEEAELVTMHDVLDSMHLYNASRNESYIRAVVQPLEVLLAGHPRIVLKDSSINAICYGAQLTVKGILRYDDFGPRDKVLLISPKGEAVAFAVALVSASQIELMIHGQITRTQRLIMGKDLYDRQWKLGPGENKEKSDAPGTPQDLQKENGENPPRIHNPEKDSEEPEPPKLEPRKKDGHKKRKTGDAGSIKKDRRTE